MPVQPQVGVSYCYVRSPVNHLYLVLGVGIVAVSPFLPTTRKIFSSAGLFICSVA